MAILGFPSSAIIGDLNWTGVSSQLIASDNISVSTGTNGFTVSANAPLADGNPNLTVTEAGISLQTADWGTELTLAADGTGITLFSGIGEVSISGGGEVFVSSGQAITLTSDGDVNVNAAGLILNSESVATVNIAQSKAIAMAIALG